MSKHPKPKKGRCPLGYHKGKTKKTKGKCVRTIKEDKKFPKLSPEEKERMGYWK